MAAIVLPSPNYELWPPVPRQGWWVSKKISFLSEAQRPEDLQKRKHGLPGQAQGTARESLAAGQPLPHNFQGRSQKGKRGSRRIQAAAPAAQGGRVRDSIRIFERRHRAFPRTMLQKVSAQRLTACDQTVMSIGQGKNGEESEGFFAPRAEATASLNPVVALVMSLFAPSAMADDRIAQTLRTAANDLFVASRCPVKARVAIVPRKWDKQNRIAWRLSR
jgi:hypothetical protein